MIKKLLSFIKWVSILSVLIAKTALSAPFAAIVIDAETGEVLHEENADTRLHPAGLTKLMSLYTAFEAIDTGLIGLKSDKNIV